MDPVLAVVATRDWRSHHAATETLARAALDLPSVVTETPVLVVVPVVSSILLLDATVTLDLAEEARIASRSAVMVIRAPEYASPLDVTVTPALVEGARIG